MAAKREQIFWKNIWPIAERLEKSFTLKAICSASILLFDKLTGDGQKEAIAEASDINQHIKSSKDETKESVQNAIQMLKDMVEVERQQPGTVYRVLTHEEQAVLDDFRKAFGPELKQKKKRKQA